MDKGYKARTDARLSGIDAADWFIFPYPGTKISVETISKKCIIGNPRLNTLLSLSASPLSTVTNTFITSTKKYVWSLFNYNYSVKLNTRGILKISKINKHGVLLHFIVFTSCAFIFQYLLISVRISLEIKVLYYLGMHGPVSYSTPVFLGFLTATFLSILDSIGDYYACASMSLVPPPPQHAVNRGIMVEGIGTIISGAIGASQATTTYGGNIGAIGVTRVHAFYLMYYL